MRTKRIVFIVLAIVVGLLLIDAVVQLIGVVSSVSTGLTIHTTPIEAVIDVPGTIAFEYSVLSSLTCTAQCSATLIRHDTLEVIAESELGVLASGTISATIDDESSLKRVPVQLIVTCSTEQTRYCAFDEQVSTDLAIARFDLDEEDRTLREAILEITIYIEEELSENLALIEALSKLESPYETVSILARDERESYEREVSSFVSALEQERYSMPPKRPEAVSAWYAELSLEPYANAESERIAQRLGRITPYRNILGSDQDGFDLIVGTYRSLDAMPSDALSFFATATSDLDRIENRSSERILTLTWNAVRNTFADLTAACTIYPLSCPEPIERPATAEEAYALSERMCNQARSLRAMDPRSLIAEELNLTLEDALESYNVTTLREEEGFAAFERSAIENASRKSANLTLGERLAITLPIRIAYCSDAFEPIRFTIPTIETEPEPISLTILSERTCALGMCDGGPAPPILFIHGHSFAESSDPRYNLQGLTRLALAFEDYGYLYAGHLFPTTTRRIGTITAPASFTATYYVNSYEEDGEIRIGTFKSEPIESYAIRLREDIEEAQRLTGSETVILVAHSMGGLVARSYLDLFGSESVEQLIMIGTPNHGIVDRIEHICPLIGASLECRDMTKGSVYLRRLNSRPLPDIPITMIAGTGCEDGDGIVQLENAILIGANTTIINGTCNGLETLHSALVDPRKELGTIEIITAQLGR